MSLLEEIIKIHDIMGYMKLKDDYYPIYKQIGDIIIKYRKIK